MNQSILHKLKCPADNQELRLEVTDQKEVEILRGKLLCNCGREYPIQNGIPNLLYPENLFPSDQEFKDKYDQSAQNYDIGLEWLFKSFSENEDSVRSKMVELLELSPNSCVLDLGCGTGSDSFHIIPHLGSEGKLFALDLSSSMLEIAKMKLANSQDKIEYFQGNASYLPFEDDTFDALLHFGGLNEFSEISKAITEMTRVVRPGGKVVIGDESVAPWLREETFGKILMNANPLYKHNIPISSLPPKAEEVHIHWIIGNAFYLIDYRVGKDLPPLDIDLPIPGKGDSLRSRYYGTKDVK